MDDYLHWQRELQKMMQQASGYSHLRLVDAEIREIRKAIQPPHEPYPGETVFDRTVRDAMQQRDLAEKTLSEVVPIGVRSLFEIFEGQRSTYDTYLELARTSRTDTTRLLDNLKLCAGMGVNELSTAAGIRNMLHDEIARMRQAAIGVRSPTGSAAIATALRGWTSVLEAASDLRTDAVASALTNPLLESARHFSESSQMLVATPNATVAHAIERSLLLTDAELRAASDVLLRFEPPTEPVSVPSPRRLLVPRFQRLELRRAALTLDENADLDDVLAAIPTGQVVLIAREVVELVVEIIDMQTFRGSGSIFKVTSRMMRACAELPFAVPVDRRTFADVMDDLYWLLYESPGSGSLRYLTEQGGPFEREDCEPIFVINRLRNFYRHDPQHGPDREIKKKREAVRADLRAHGLERLQSRSDYRTLHRLLLEEVVMFLRSLRSAISH